MYDIRARWQFRNFSKFPNFFPVRLRGGPRHARAEGDRSGELTAMAPPKLKRCLRLVVVFGASSVVAVESPRVTLVYPMGRSGVPRECMTSHARQWASHACGLSRGTMGCL